MRDKERPRELQIKGDQTHRTTWTQHVIVGGVLEPGEAAQGIRAHLLGLLDVDCGLDPGITSMLSFRILTFMHSYRTAPYS